MRQWNGKWLSRVPLEGGVASDEYNYTVPRLIASTAAIKTVFVLPLDCARTRTHTRVVDGYDD